MWDFQYWKQRITRKNINEKNWSRYIWNDVYIDRDIENVRLREKVYNWIYFTDKWMNEQMSEWMNEWMNE